MALLDLTILPWARGQNRGQNHSRILLWAWAWAWLVLASVLGLAHGAYGGSYDQMVLVLGQKPYYRVHHDPHSAVLTIDLRQVSPKELEPLQLYDADLINRVWLEQLPDQMTRVKLFLKDPAIRFAVRDHSHPFRLAIELYTPGTLEARDPRTGLPLLPEASHVAQAAQVARTAQVGQAAQAPIPPKRQLLTPPGSLALSAKTSPRLASPSRVATPAPAVRGRKRRLLQPIPKLADDPAQRMAELAQIKGGRLPGWQSFPPFIYRINTNAYKNSENYQRFLHSAAAKARHSAELSRLGRYAAQQYEFGHEQRSLAAYRYILQNAPQLFNTDPLHLWRMAELNLGSRNFALAKGYYQAVLAQFPTSEMAGFAELRLADLRWLQDAKRPRPLALIEASEDYKTLADNANAELSTQAVIRLGFLEQQLGQKTAQPNLEQDQNIPPVSLKLVKVLRRQRQQLDNPKTVFYSRAIALCSLLSHSPAAIATAVPRLKSFTAAYRKQPDPAVPAHLKALLRRNANAEVAKAFKAKDYLAVVEQSKALPSSWPLLDKASHYAVAESYRALGQYPKAAEHYQRYRTKEPSLANFIAGFWQLDAMAKSAELLGQKDRAKRRKLHRQTRSHDRGLWQNYNKLSSKERVQAITQLKADLIRLSQNRRFIATPARIVLSVWRHSLTPGAASLENPNMLPKWQPDSRTVARLTNLKKTFHLQGLKSHSLNTERLLAALDPKLFRNDPIAKKIWTKEILKLAEAFRKDKQFLQAGRMYALSAREDDGWEGRAEALYKGGLLLYRAGKRQEAEAAFRTASLDVNNVLYAELAKKRLEQISKP